jgi:hypothetical protein
MGVLFSKPKTPEVPPPPPPEPPVAQAESGSTSIPTERKDVLSRRKTNIAGFLSPTNLLKRKILG